ncbi:hypothetical protein [Salipiger thiooxidans]|uniref:hypothetical protein n=1 Tax=Salipiger thiooxidans TaxID=282683 RepID=UPI001041C123|nr:hypothetical protein [Salipiger thiooxidans]
MRYFIHLSTAISVILLPAVSSAQEICKHLVSGGVFNVTSYNLDTEDVDAFSNWLCDTNASSSSGSSSGSGYINVPLKVGQLGLGGGGSQMNSQQTFAQYCSTENRFTQSRTEAIAYLQKAAPEIIDGFNECLNRDGLHVWIEFTSDPEVFKIASKFKFAGLIQDLPKIMEVVLPKGVTCDPSLENFDFDDIGQNNTRRSVCKRTGKEAVSIVFNAEADPLGGGDLSLPAIYSPPIAPSCAVRQIMANHQSYYSDYPDDTPGEQTSVGVGVGGGSHINSDRAFLRVDRDCKVSLTVSIGARGGQRFPDAGSAPWISVTANRADGSLVLNKTNTATLADVATCGGVNKKTIPLEFITPEMVPEITGFDVFLSGSSPINC